MSDRLSQETIEARLAEFPDWSVIGDSLQRTLSFDTFIEAMHFVNRVADLAEDVQHHPDILVRYNKVTLTLSTHDAGGLTERDFNFARETDAYLKAV